MEGLADGAVTCGLPRDKANTFAPDAAGRSLATLESGKPFGQMKDEICSPGGTTIAGVRALEEGGLPRRRHERCHRRLRKDPSAEEVNHAAPAQPGAAYCRKALPPGRAFSDPTSPYRQ